MRCCYHAGVAQLVEQLICNQQVGGSSPSTSSILFYGGIPERPKGADCKSVAFSFSGSNPLSPTKFNLIFDRSAFVLIHSHCEIYFILRMCWNWQTGTFEGRVFLTYGFKSHHSHHFF